MGACAAGEEKSETAEGAGAIERLDVHRDEDIHGARSEERRGDRGRESGRAAVDDGATRRARCRFALPAAEPRRGLASREPSRGGGAPTVLTERKALALALASARPPLRPRRPRP